jgi:hypothetical protein
VVIDVVHGDDEPGFESEEEEPERIRSSGDREIDRRSRVGEVALRQKSGGHFQEVTQVLLARVGHGLVQ